MSLYRQTLPLFLDGFYCYPFQLIQLAYDAVIISLNKERFTLNSLLVAVGSFQKVVPNVELCFVYDAGV